MAFAFGLLQQHHELHECHVLTEDERFADRLDTLTSLFGR